MTFGRAIKYSMWAINVGLGYGDPVIKLVERGGDGSLCVASAASVISDIEAERELRVV